MEGKLDESTSDNSVEIILYGRRWGMLALGSFANLCNAILWITFAPITSVAADYYDTSVLGIVMLSLIFLALYVPGSALASSILQSLGVRKGLLIGALLNLVSAVLRWLSSSNKSNNESTYENAYALLLIGQGVGAVAQPFFTNMPARFSALWFPQDQRAIATTLFSASNLVGIALGSTVPSFFVTQQNTTGTAFDDGTGKRDICDIFALLLTEVIIIAISFLLIVLLFQEKPPTAPSKTQQLLRDSREAAEKLSAYENGKQVMKEIKLALGNKEFLKIFIAAAIGLGYFNSITTLIETLTKPAGYSVDDATLFSGAFLGGGLISALVFGIIMDRTHKYVTLFRVLGSCATITIVVLMLMIRPDNGSFLTVLFALSGIFMIPILPIGFELGAEVTYPLNEDVSTGLLMVGGQLTGIPYLLVMEHLIKEQPDFVDADSFKYEFTPTYYISVFSMFVFWLFAMWENGSYVRLAAEKKEKLEKESKEKMLEEMEEEEFHADKKDEKAVLEHKGAKSQHPKVNSLVDEARGLEKTTSEVTIVQDKRKTDTSSLNVSL